MNLKTVISSAIILASGFTAQATSIPYPNTGVVAPTTNIIAMGGDIKGQYVGFLKAAPPAFIDTVSIYDATTGVSSAQVFNNTTTAVGALYDFGTFAKGDVLDFELTVVSAPGYLSTGTRFSSAPSRSADGLNHAYFSSFAGGPIANVYGDTKPGTNFMSGTYVGMEDYTITPGSSLADYDDDSYIFSNIAPVTSATPEPSSVLLLGGGLLAAFGVIARKKVNA